MKKNLPPIKQLAANHCGSASKILLLTISLLMAMLVPSALYAQQKINNISNNTKEIEGYGDVDFIKYYLIASPLRVIVNPTRISGLIAEDGSFDLYYFDQHEKKEWRNYKFEEFDLSLGKGYLYASRESVTLTFPGTHISSNSYNIVLFYDEGAEFAGWNLVGNPFSETAYLNRDFYRMNGDGSEIIIAESPEINPMEGVFVLASEDGEEVTFETKENGVNGSSFSLDLLNSRGVIDRTVVRLGSGRQLPKFQLWESSTKLFIPIDGTDYAMVSSQGKGELPVHFKAKDNGSYTISLNSKEVRFAYLHLIDHLTGDDIDLLAHPDYTFHAKTTDDPSRFHLVFSAESMSPDSPDGGTSYTPDMSDCRIKRDFSCFVRLPEHGKTTNQDAGNDGGEEILYTLSFEAGIGGEVKGDFESGVEQEEGSKIILQALAAEGYCFLNWTENGEEVSTDSRYQFNMYSDRNLKANFALILKDGEKNSTTIGESEAENVILQDRFIYNNGDWSTLCLPFNVESLEGTPLEGFTVKELDIQNASDGHVTGLENGTLYLNFKDAAEIEAGKPYIVKKDITADLIIKSADDWNSFAQNVNNGMSYEGNVVKLGADINVSTMAGKDECPFEGTFDGNGHTIKLDLKGGGEGLALFYIIDGATILNVKVTGKVTSTYHRPATFAAFVEGSSTIKNCWSSVDIVSTHNNAWIDGGAFVARVSAGVTLTMTDCAFTGSVTYNPNTCSGGSMVGFTQSGATANLTNCTYFPTALALTAVNYNPHIFVSGNERGNLTNCYYNDVARESILKNEGFDINDYSIATQVAALGTNWEAGTSYAILKLSFGFNNPLFKTVTISSTEPTAVSSEDGTVSFMGNYDPMSLAANATLCMGSGNTLCYPSEANTINAFRAWFCLPGGIGNASMGDVNGDSLISVTDVMEMVSYVLGTVNSGFVVENADINGDGQISVTDVMALVDKILQGDQTISDIVVNGADGLIYSGGGNGPARVSRK